MPNDDYEYPYGDAQIHDALADLDKRLKALEPKQEKPVESEENALGWAPIAGTESNAVAEA